MRIGNRKLERAKPEEYTYSEEEEQEITTLRNMLKAAENNVRAMNTLWIELIDMKRPFRAVPMVAGLVSMCRHARYRARRDLRNIRKLYFDAVMRPPVLARLVKDVGNNITERLNESSFAEKLMLVESAK